MLFFDLVCVRLNKMRVDKEYDVVEGFFCSTLSMVKGVTNSVAIPFQFEGTALDPYGNLRVGFEGSTVINRKDYGITWNAALETGGVLVSDKITLEFEVSAIKTA